MPDPMPLAAHDAALGTAGRMPLLAPGIDRLRMEERAMEF